ncbi:FHA domain-containing protein, partial [Mycobacterium fragae]|uniref:FHA domain-containing protein n=1 Tax=Mycobacterium fragae TaxID=1260918 RepID=UPI001D09AFBB
MPTEAFASPLIVWLGSKRYAFPPGRDVIVGHDRRADIRIERRDEFTPPTAVVLHYDGRQWVAIDRSRHGIYVDGARMSTVFIHDGQVIMIGHPQYGSRLVFQVGAPAHPPPRPGPGMPPPPPRPVPPRRIPGQPEPTPAPSRFPTQRFQARRPQPEPPRRTAPELPSQLQTQRMRWAQSQRAEAPARPAQPKPPPSHPEPPVCPSIMADDHISTRR